MGIVLDIIRDNSRYTFEKICKRSYKNFYTNGLCNFV